MFGCLADKAYASDDTCLINDSNACNFGIAVGVIGMVMCLGFFTKDIVYIIVKHNKVKFCMFCKSNFCSVCMFCLFNNFVTTVCRFEVFCY